MSINPENKKSRLVESDPVSINRNQLNSSSAKMQYSMPKAERFKYKHENIANRFYDIPDTKSKRSASFGFGKKMDLGKQNFARPGPSEYSLKSQFEDELLRKKGITISAGREIIKNNSVFLMQKDIPGPGKYNPKDNTLNQRSYTMAAKVRDVSNKWIQAVPGPGAYDKIQVLDDNMKSINSKIRNVKSTAFSKEARKGQFEQYIRQNIPGPGQYSKQGQLEKMAKYRKSSSWKFSQANRDGLIQKSQTKIPGPGSYNVFSEFIK